MMNDEEEVMRRKGERELGKRERSDEWEEDTVESRSNGLEVKKWKSIQYQFQS